MKTIRLLLAVMVLAVIFTACSKTDLPQTDGADQNVQEQETQSLSQEEEDHEEQLPAKWTETDLTPSEGLEFESNGDGTCNLLGIGICKDSDLVIPGESPEGETLVLIEEYAFAGLEDVTSVTLLNTACEVDDQAFQYAEIQQVNVIGGAPVFGTSVFSACEDLNSINFQDCELEMGEYGFFGCGKDAQVTFTNCTGLLDKYCFQYGDILSLTIDNCQLAMEDSVFSSCEDMTSIVFKNSTLEMNQYAFFGAGDKAVLQVENCNLLMDDYTFQYCSLEQVNISGESLNVGDSGFGACEDLTAVVIDCPQVILGEYAFFGCDHLTTVSISDNKETDNVIEIGDWAFQYCKELSSVVVGSGEVEVGQGVFYGGAEDMVVTIGEESYKVM